MESQRQSQLQHAISLRKQGHFNAARQELQTLLALTPNCITTKYYLSVLLIDLGEYPLAEHYLQELTRHNPEKQTYWYHLGLSQAHQKKWPEALQQFNTAAKLDANNTNNLCMLAQALQQLQHHLQAFNVYCMVQKQDPLNAIAQYGLQFNFQFLDPSLEVTEERIDTCLELDFFEPRLVEKNISNYFYRKLQTILLQPSLTQISANKTFIQSMHKILFVIPELENCMRLVRIALLNTQHLQLTDYLGLAIAMSAYTYHNESVINISESEQRQLAYITNHLHEIQDWNTENLDCLLKLSMYHPEQLLQFKWLNNHWEQCPIPQLKQLLMQYILNVQTERTLRSEIQSLMPHATDKSMSDVQQQYEQNPYPRWLTVGYNPNASYIQQLRQANPKQPIFNKNLQAPSVLIAGCGTGRHTLITALENPNSEILSIDFSKASLAYATRQLSTYKLNAKVKFRAADILDLTKLKQQFDIIESIGVLHHMQSPEQGLASLVPHLKPTGFIKLGLYSQHARESISEIRKGQKEALSEKSVIQKRDNLIQDMLNNKNNYPFKYSSDFYSLSGCRDLLFNAQEHVFTIPRIQSLLKQCDLTFWGWSQLSPLTIQAFQQQFGLKANLTDLELWNEFEILHPFTFSSMYQFWSTPKNN